MGLFADSSAVAFIRPLRQLLRGWLRLPYHTSVNAWLAQHELPPIRHWAGIMERCSDFENLFRRWVWGPTRHSMAGFDILDIFTLHTFHFLDTVKGISQMVETVCLRFMYTGRSARHCGFM